MCELLLRGAQTPGELRSRASRMASFADVSEVEATLERLSEREGGPYVMRLAREPGRRESRYAHLFSGEVAAAAAAPGAAAAMTAPGPAVSAPETAFPASRQEERLSRLEEEVEALRAAVNELKTRLGSQ